MGIVTRRDLSVDDPGSLISSYSRVGGEEVEDGDEECRGVDGTLLQVVYGHPRRVTSGRLRFEPHPRRRKTKKKTTFKEEVYVSIPF